MYDPRKDISRSDAEEAIKECFEGYAGEFDFPNETPLVLGSFQQYEPQEPLQITQRTFECAHRIVVGKGRTLEGAVADFQEQARFDWPSLKNRFTIAWRQKPQITVDQEFDTMQPVFKVAARYALILDWEPPEKKEAGQ